MDAAQQLQQKCQVLLPLLNERQRRLWAAAEARSLGHGGIVQVSAASGLSRPTIHKALQELEGSPLLPDRVRQPGGGRKKSWVKDPGLLLALETLIDPTTRGDPLSPLRWTCKSTRHLAQALAEQGYAVSHVVVAEMLDELGYSLQGNTKTIEGKQHPDRDAQFQYINRTTKAYLRQELPAISVDAKKKELVGHYANGGQEWHPQGQPERVKGHDFPDPKVGKGIPYGLYEMGRNRGWVTVGCDHDTARFAVESIRRWWQRMGAVVYPKATKLLICADAGGSNGYRIRLWKVALQELANETGLAITVCHFPPGTSKWNKIEHRLFAHITMNWRGRPLLSHQVIVNLIKATTTRTGLQVDAELDLGSYPTKVRVPDEQMQTVNIKRHSFHGEWNYTIKRNV